MEINRNNFNKNFFTQSRKTVKQEVKSEDSSYGKEAEGLLDCFVPFCGVKKVVDATILFDDLKMVPKQEYIVDEKSGFYLSDVYVSLSDPDIEPYVNNLKNNQSIIIGMGEIKTQNMNETVSSRHLKIKKDSFGRLIAKDLNSKNGTKIAKNVVNFDFKTKLPYKLESGRKYLVPKNSILELNDFTFSLIDYEEKINELKGNNSLIVGRSDSADIKVDDPYVSNKHLKIQNYENGFIVEDLNSEHGTFITGYQMPEFVSDFSNIDNITYLEKNIPTLLPKDAQVHIKGGYTIDLRNKNILNLLKEKGDIIIGRDDFCDIVIPDLHESASQYHLGLKLTNSGIVAKDLGSESGTQVIPKNKIKPFYEDMKNLNLGQRNIGDCYLLSSIYAIAHHPNGEKILNSMVKVDDNGNYIVTFYDSNPIKVTLEELDGQTNEYGVIKRSVSGELGIKAIERAYAKKVKYNNRRPPDNYTQDKKNKTLFMGIDVGVDRPDFLKILTGKTPGFHLLDDNFEEILKKIDENGGLNKYLIICPSLHNANDDDDFVDKDKKIYQKHMYAIKNYDIENKTIELINPHNTKKPLTVTFEEFLKYFRYIAYCMI